VSFPGLPQPASHVRRRRVAQGTLKALIAVVAALLVLAGAGLGYVEYRDHQIHRIQVGDIVAIPPSGVENILLVGSNSRCVLNGQQAAAFGTCAEVGGARSDVTMLVHLDPVHRSAFVLSIPRDLFVPIPGTTSANRVDAALNVGPTRLVRTIEDDLGIPINHYVELNFDSFQNVVNALGGIDMYFPDPVRDAYSGLDITTPGCHHLNGFEALAVVRARHLYYEADGVWHYDGLGDLSRIKRDHEFLKVLASAVARRGLGNPFTDNALIGAIAPQLQVDSAFSIGEMLGLVLTFHSVNPNAVPTETLPVAIDPNPYYYKGYDYGDVVFPSYPQDQQAIDAFLGTTTPPAASVDPATVTVSVLNGTKDAGQAEATAGALSRLGFDVVGTGNAEPVGSVAETVVYYRPGEQPAAERVLEDLTGAVIMGEGPTTPGADVTVVTGSDFSVLPPSATTAPAPSATASASPGSSQGEGSASAAAAGTAPATSVSASSGALSPPTAAHEALPPFDPRSCAPGRGPGP
jgi:LCP family protein required for cell wall assembly